MKRPPSPSSAISLQERSDDSQWALGSGVGQGRERLVAYSEVQVMWGFLWLVPDIHAQFYLLPFKLFPIS